MQSNHKTPKLKTHDERGKITAYPELEIEELYKVGKMNGWDTPQIVKEAITEALLARADLLRRPAKETA